VTKLERIVVATDFSPGAARAVERAAQLASAHGARLDILHARQTLPGRLLTRLGAGASAKGQEEARVRQGLDEATRVARAAGVEATAHAREGSAVKAVQAFLRKARADLLVVGARGERTVRQVVLGSTADRLVERGLCTTLVVRQPARAAYRAALACVALGEGSRRVIEAAAALGDDVFVHIMHAYEPPYEGKLRSYGVDEAAIRSHRREAKQHAERTLAALVRDSSVPSARLDTVLRGGHPVKAILRSAERLGCDVVAMGRRDSAIDSYLLGSVTKEVLRSTSSDVLVVAGD
jgi:nucleotide-binding universal stress UspA family protein